MKVKHLIQGMPGLSVKGSKEIEITGLSADSRTLSPGNLFIAKRGLTQNGAEFIPQAINAGVSAIVTSLYNPFVKITQIICPDPGKIEAELACRYYRDPSKDLWVVGITGTKGKTTTSYLIRHLLNRLDFPCGLIGTIETIIGEKRVPSTHTTQDVIRNQKSLSEMRAAQCKAAVLEVSSHGLKQGRVDGIDFALALFTNLTPDHFDYHQDMNDYASAKKMLLDRARKRIFNADSPWSDFMRGAGAGMTYGIERPADLTASQIVLTDRGTSLVASYQGQNQTITSPLMGRFNVSNLLGALAVGLHLGAPLERLASIFANLPQIPGRLEQVPNDRGVSVFVDFAHSGEPLDNVLSTLREISKKKLIVVFGCGGNRDPMRRSQMAAAAEKWADLAIVTTDNPRNEDPEEICRQILAGFQKPQAAILEIDRKKAIRLSVDLAQEGDVILIAGKGHERTQIFGTQTIPFDDVEIAKEALQNRGHSAILA